MDRASLARREDFLIPCPAFRCSLICPLYFYLPSPPAPGLSAFTRLLMSFCRGRASAGQQLQLEGSSLGIGLAVRPQSLRLFSCLPFLRLVSCLCVSALFPSLACPLQDLSRARGAPRGVRGSERPSVARGLAPVPRLYFEEKLTGAPFRRQPQHNRRRL